MGPDRVDVIAIRKESDIVAARRAARLLGEGLGFSLTDGTLLATAISELARNIVLYGGGSGRVSIRPVERGKQRGIEVVAEDSGPGIRDIELALTDGWSSGSGLGLGLPGTRRLVDEFAIESVEGAGTRIVVVKWTS